MGAGATGVGANIDVSAAKGFGEAVAVPLATPAGDEGFFDATATGAFAAVTVGLLGLMPLVALVAFASASILRKFS